MEHELNKLVKQIKKRKPEALERVMELFMASVYGVARAILAGVASEGDIEECVQDVFIEAWNSIERFDPERGSLKTWLLIICKYRSLNLRRALLSKGKVINLEEVQLSARETPEEDYIAKEGKEEVIAAIKDLGETDREVFLRKYILNQTIDEICTVMNLTRQAVDNKLWRGRKKLKELFSLKEGGVINE